MGPKVSIVTPSYNQGDFIEETINSVLEQDYKNFEYIIIDGGSSDSTISIIKRYEKYIKFWISEKDNGQSDAINKGWLRSEGKIFCYLNSDDLFEKYALSKITEEFGRNSKLGIVYGDCNIINSRGEIIGKMTGREISFKTLLSRGQERIFQPASFFKAELVRQYGYLNTQWQYCMDYDLILKLVKISPLCYVHETLASYRMHNQSKSMSQAKIHWKEKFEVRRQYSKSLFIYAHIKYILFLILNFLPKPINRIIRRIRHNPLDKTITSI